MNPCEEPSPYNPDVTAVSRRIIAREFRLTAYRTVA